VLEPVHIEERYLADFRALADPPDDPLELQKWVAGILARDLKRLLTGKAHPFLSAEIRAIAGSISKAMPFARLVEAERVVKTARKPQDKPRASGPKPEPVDLDDGDQSRRNLRPSLRG
jgi:hypothetical protein